MPKEKTITVGDEKLTSKQLMERVPKLKRNGACKRMNKWEASAKKEKDRLYLFRPCKPNLYAMASGKKYTPEDLMKKIPGLKIDAARLRIRAFNLGASPEKKLFAPGVKSAVVDGVLITSKILMQMIPLLSRAGADSRINRYLRGESNERNLFAPTFLQRGSKCKPPKIKLVDMTPEEFKRRKKVRDELAKAGKIEEACRQRLKRNNLYDERGICLAPVNPKM